MKHRTALSILILVSLLAGGRSWAQGSVLTLEITFEGQISEAVADQFRGTIQEGSESATEFEVLDEAASQAALGDDADRLMTCGNDSSCLAEAGEVSGAQAAMVFTVSESGEIYTFAVDTYDLRSGNGIGYYDAECPLCTIDEAAASLQELAGQAAAEIPIEGEPVTEAVERTVAVVIQVEPPAGEVYLDGELAGQGEVAVELTPGSYPLRVTLDGYQPVEQDLEITATSEDLEVAVRLVELEEEAPPATAMEETWFDRTAVGSILLGTGAAALITGVILLAIDGESSCSEGELEQCPELYDTFAGGLTLTILGSAVAGSGGMLIIWDVMASPDAPPPEETTSFGIDLREDGAAFVIGGSF